jgi:hypothetical protein
LVLKEGDTICYIVWHSTVAKKPCYEALDEIEGCSYTMPFEWVDGKKVFPYGYYWTLERMAMWRKNAILRGEKPLVGDYAYPCGMCQIKYKCDAGFPKEKTDGIISKFINIFS